MEDKKVSLYTNEYLAKNANIGMSHVDPIDVLPPQILLVQKSSDLSALKDGKGNSAKIGQYFHTGKNEIMDDFEAWILFAAKGKYTDKRKPEDGVKLQYKAIGVMIKDGTLFAIKFRSSALFTLAPLFTSVVSAKRPMYAIKTKFEVKKLSGDKGEWFVPVCRVTGIESDQEKLTILERQAVLLEMQGEKIVNAEDDDKINKIPDDGLELTEPH